MPPVVWDVTYRNRATVTLGHPEPIVSPRYRGLSKASVETGQRKVFELARAGPLVAHLDSVSL